MSRRTTPQKTRDDRALPVRLLLLVPEAGFGRHMETLHEWLVREVGRTEYAWHGGGRWGGQRDLNTMYFRHPRDAARMLDAFPWLELADGTASAGYTSPYLPFGRR